MLVDMSKAQQPSKTSKRQGIVYNGDESIDNLVDFPSSFTVEQRIGQQNGSPEFSNLLKYDKDDETRKSTGSIHNIVSTQEHFHVRSSSDTSENFLPASYRINQEPPSEQNGDQRPSSGDSFFAIIQRFENASLQKQLGQRLTALTIKKPVDGTDFIGTQKLFKSPFTSGTSSPSGEKKAYLNLKRKSSLKASAARKAKSDERPVILDDKNWEKPRKAFAHYDVQSAALDFDSLANSRQKNGDCLRRKNIITGASAASGRETAAVIADKKQPKDSDASTDEASDLEEGDNKSNELVESCPYFRNELGGEQDEIFGAFRYNSSYKELTGQENKNKRHSTLDVVLTAYDSIRRGQIFSATGVTVLDSAIEQEDSSEQPTDLCYIENDRKIFEHVDHGAFYYRKHFLARDHTNYLGEDERLGVTAISYRRTKADVRSVFSNVDEDGPTSQYEYHIIVRTSEMETLRGSILEECIPSTSRHGTARGLPPKDILEYVCPEISLSCLKLATAGPKVPEILLKLDEQGVTRQHKIGILYCKAGQSTEEEMYNNEEAGPAFNEFLDIIGERVALKGFEGYRAQLDNRNDSTGEYSLYRKFSEREVMFHVSTMLPWTPNNRQQLLRKRHIGNDIVTIVFQEPGAEPFTPKNIRSHFQHVFILVRVFDPCTSNTRYQVAVSRSKDVPAFGPPIPANGVFNNKTEFETFLLTKLINAENAAHKSKKFRAMAVRTRHEYLKDLMNNYITNSTIETGAKFGKFSLGSKKKEKVHPHVNPEVLSKGGISWDVEVEDTRNMSMIPCLLVLSVESFVLIDKSTREAIFYIPCKAMIGWTPMSRKLKLFHGGGDCLVLNLPRSEDIPTIVRRLERVTIGCQTIAMTLRRHHSGQLGFNVHNGGMVVEVEPNGLAQVAGLKQQSRLVEIFGNAVATMSYVDMVNELRRPGHVPVVVIPPLPNGRPRKGLQLAAVNYNSPNVSLDSYVKHPKSSQSIDESSLAVIRDGDDLSHYSSNSTLRFDSAADISKEHEEARLNGTPWVLKANTPGDGEERYPEQQVQLKPSGAFIEFPGSPQSSALNPPSSGAMYGTSYTVTAKKATGNETVLSLKYFPRPTAPTPTMAARRDETDDAEYSPARYPRVPPKVADKRSAADLLKSKLNAHTRTDSHLRGYHNRLQGTSTYTPPRPDRGPGYNQDERRMVSNYKPNDTPPSSKKTSPQQEASTMQPPLEIIHSRSKSEPWDPGNFEEGMRRTYKETTLGPHITTVETFRENFDNAMSDTVDQIEKAFGGSPPTTTTSDQSPREALRGSPAAARLHGDSENYQSSSNESLPTSDAAAYSDSEREHRKNRGPFSSKRLVSKKIGVRAEITSTTAKSPGATTDTHRDVTTTPSIQSSTTVFVRSKSNEGGSREATPKRTLRHVGSNTLPRTVNREEVVISRENNSSGVVTPRRRQGLIREPAQNSDGGVSYVYSPRPFHMPSTLSRGGAANHEPEAFQFPDTNASQVDKPKVVSQTKICLMSPPSTGSPTTTHVIASKATPENSVPSSPRSSVASDQKGGAAKTPRTPVPKVPYFVKTKRGEYTGITPELVDERISKIVAGGKQRSKKSPDIGRRASSGSAIKDTTDKEPLQTFKSRAPAEAGQQPKPTEATNESRGEDSVLDEMTYMLSQTDAMTRDASKMLASCEKVLSGEREPSKATPTAIARARLPSDGACINVILPLNVTSPTSTPRRHSFDDSMLSATHSHESLESITNSRQTLLASKDGFHRISELETKVTELSYFLQKEREENIQLKRKLIKIEKSRGRK